jgi:hypothetical protein
VPHHVICDFRNDKRQHTLSVFVETERGRERDRGASCLSHLTGFRDCEIDPEMNDRLCDLRSDAADDTVRTHEAGS